MKFMEVSVRVLAGVLVALCSASTFAQDAGKKVALGEKVDNN